MLVKMTYSNMITLSCLSVHCWRQTELEGDEALAFNVLFKAGGCGLKLDLSRPNCY